MMEKSLNYAYPRNFAEGGEVAVADPNPERLEPATAEADQLSDTQLSMLRAAEQMAISSGQMPEELAGEINRYYGQLDQYDFSQFEPNQVEYVTGLMDYLGMPYTQRNLFEVLDNQFGSKNTVSADTLNMLFPGGNSDRMSVLTALSSDNYGQYDPNKQYGAQNQANTQGDLNQAAADATAAIGDVAQPTSAPVTEGPVTPTPLWEDAPEIDWGIFGNRQNVTVTPGADALAGAGYEAPTNTIGDVYTGSGTPAIPTTPMPDPVVTTPVQPNPVVPDPFQPAPVVPGVPGNINIAPIDTSGVTSPAQNLSMGNIAGAFTSNPPPPAGGQQAYQNFVSPELQAYQAPTMTGAAQGLGSLMSDPLQQQEEENPYLLSSTPTSSVFSRPGG